jgi:hypothetical protein
MRAVARLIQTHDLAGLDFLLTRAGHQDAIDCLPCLGPDGEDGSGAAPTSLASTAGTREGPKRGRVF